MKNHTYLLLGIALAAAASAATPSLKEKFGEALYTESVLREPEKAAGMFENIVVSYRNAGSPAELGEHAAAALFRLAEIREREGAEEESKKLYRLLLDQFPKHEPQARIARSKLGLEHTLPKRLKLIEVSEDDESTELAQGLYRKRWRFSSELNPDELLMTTFEVKHKEGYANEGLPPAFQLRTLHHAPSGHINHWFSRTTLEWSAEYRKRMYEEGRKAGRHETHGPDRINEITGFGHSYTVPEGLHWSGAGWGGSSMAFFFTDEYSVKEVGSSDYRKIDPTKWLTVRLSTQIVSVDRALTLLEPLKLEIPGMGDEAWSLPLPPAPAELQEQNKGE